MKKGFTLVEMLVTIGIFSLMVNTIVGAFIFGISLQRRILAEAELLNEINFALEYMERALRMAKKDDIEIWKQTKNCLTGEKVNFEVTREGKGIKFRNYENQCQEFYLSNGRLVEEREEETNYLTSEKIKITNFQINLIGEPQGDQKQPRVTIFIEVEAETIKNLPKLQIQTTISQRDLDVEY